MLTPCLWYFYSRGALLDLYEGYIVFNAGYGADAVSFKEMCRNYSQWVKRDIMYPSMLMYIVGGAGVILSRMPAREKIYYTAAFLITCMGVQGNGKTHFNHYAQTLIPFAAVGYLVAPMAFSSGCCGSDGLHLPELRGFFMQKPRPRMDVRFCSSRYQ